MTPLDAQRAIIGATVRGTLTTRDLRDLQPGWHRIEGAGLYHRLLTDLHIRMLVACEATLELRRRVDIPTALRMLALEGWPAGRVVEGVAHGYLPDLARAAPRRGLALRALGVVLYEAERRRGAEQARATRAATEALREVERIAGETERRRARVLPGLVAAIEAAGGVA